jgi:hypothetical protein
MQQPEPAPPAPGRRDQHDRDGSRPADVQRRHRGVLVGERVRRAAVHGRPDGVPGVHHAGQRQESRRGQRHEHLHEEGGRGQQSKGGARPPVQGRPSQVRPQENGGRGGEVHAGVVQVRRAHHPVMADHQPLQSRLAGQPQGALQVPHVHRVGVRGGQVTGDGQAAQLVRQEKDRDEQQLPDGPWSCVHGGPFPTDGESGRGAFENALGRGRVVELVAQLLAFDVHIGQ